MSRIGFIGLGMMGAPMAHLLHQAGYQMVVRDALERAERTFLDAHADASSGREASAFSTCDVIITMLPNSSIVDQVIADLAPHLKSGACIIEMSSADPSRTRALAERLAENNVYLIDAPVSGGVKRAMSGSLAIMVGGDKTVAEKWWHILALLGNSITHVGPVGAGHALKALNNYVSAAALIATAEAIQAGAAYGIEPATVVDVINTSTGKNNTTENKAHQFMLNGAFNSGFSLILQAKDVGIAAKLGPPMGLPMALAQQIAAMTSAASEALGATADHTEIYKYVGER
ncbi:MAG: 2-hydroxy-3-oxopropionate reductase [Betaproteobacteria bacterium HGW-Betaproteobacteria-9]|jgi:3-hydroxyisobutyrate dehydrogenase|nr:MAG: 2-hydroxy-3-oxopropionate reductase [Betaproteobacteria bacterium HGW-Betaproteobacteria-9]